MSDIFIVYSRSDSDICVLLVKQLRSLFHSDQLTFFSDKDLEVGDKWRKVIKENLNYSRCAILIISSNAMASDFIRKTELPWFLGNNKKIFPLNFEAAPIPNEIENLQIFPSDDCPLKTIDEKEWPQLITEFVKKIANHLKSSQGSPAGIGNTLLSIDPDREKLAEQYANEYNKTNETHHRKVIFNNIMNLYIENYRKGFESEVKGFVKIFDDNVDKTENRHEISSEKHGVEIYNIIIDLLLEGLPKPTHFFGLSEPRIEDVFINPAYARLLPALKEMEVSYKKALKTLNCLLPNPLIKSCALFYYMVGQSIRKTSKGEDKEKQLEQGLRYFDKGIDEIRIWDRDRKCPCNSPERCKPNLLLAELHRGRATVYRKLNRYDHAKKAYLEAIRTCKCDSNAMETVGSDIYFSYGYFLFESFFKREPFPYKKSDDGEISEIYNQFNESNKLKGINTAALPRLAIIDLYKGDYEEAFRRFNRVVQEEIVGSDIKFLMDLNEESILSFINCYTVIFHLCGNKESSFEIKFSDIPEDMRDPNAIKGKLGLAFAEKEFSMGTLECHTFDLDVIRKSLIANENPIKNPIILQIIDRLNSEVQKRRPRKLTIIEQ